MKREGLLDAIERYINAYGAEYPESFDAAFHNNATKERNISMLADRLNGLTLTQLESKYGISRERIRMLLQGAGARLYRLSLVKETTVDEQVVPADPLQAFMADITARSRNCILNAGIKTIEDLARRTPEDLMLMRNFGRVSLLDITSALGKHGLSLATKGGDPNG